MPLVCGFLVNDLSKKIKSEVKLSAPGVTKGMFVEETTSKNKYPHYIAL
jgi:hypothetical protein